MSFRPSGICVCSAVTESLQHFSIVNSPLRILSAAVNACLGSISVRNPRMPMFIARIGGSGFGMVMQVRSMVPSPPMVMRKSVFMAFSGVNCALAFIFPFRVSSTWTSTFFLFR